MESYCPRNMGESLLVFVINDSRGFYRPLFFAFDYSKKNNQVGEGLFVSHTWLRLASLLRTSRLDSREDHIEEYQIIPKSRSKNLWD